MGDLKYIVIREDLKKKKNYSDILRQSNPEKDGIRWGESKGDSQVSVFSIFYLLSKNVLAPSEGGAQEAISYRA